MEFTFFSNVPVIYNLNGLEEKRFKDAGDLWKCMFANANFKIIHRK